MLPVSKHFPQQAVEKNQPQPCHTHGDTPLAGSTAPGAAAWPPPLSGSAAPGRPRRTRTGVRDAHAGAALLHGHGAVQGVLVLVQDGGHGPARPERGALS